MTTFRKEYPDLRPHAKALCIDPASKFRGQRVELLSFPYETPGLFAPAEGATFGPCVIVDVRLADGRERIDGAQIAMRATYLIAIKPGGPPARPAYARRNPRSNP